MIVTSGFIRMSAEHLEQIKPDLIKAAQAAREQDGCIGYAFSADLEDPGKMWASEYWRDMDAIKAHMAKPHFAALAAALGSVEVLEQSVTLYPCDEPIAFA